MNHAITQVRSPNKARQILMITAIIACVLSIFTLFALSAQTARPSSFEADPYGAVDELHEHRIPFHRDPDLPGRRF